MKINKFLPVLLFLFTILILFMPSLALAGAENGLLLWYRSLLPALLPFMILSGILVETKALLPLCRLLHPVLKRLFPISPAGCTVLLLGFFCGFPMGGRVTADLLKSKQISKSEAQYLLGFCNNFSPAFLTGFVKTFVPGIPTWNLFLVVFGSPLLFGILSGKKAVKNDLIITLPEETKEESKQVSFFSIVDDSIMRGFSSITRLGGYLILFGIFAKMVTALKTVTILKAILLTLTEITTSIPYTASMVTNPILRERILLSGLVFGGMSGIAQTKSMIADSTLSIRQYAFTRLKITGMAVLITYLCILIRNLPALHLP